eukprot:SAG11_NODE_11629_length_747_cov_1.746914_2_plen_104_part_00
MEPQAENPQGRSLSDMPIEVVHRIGDFLKPFDKRRLGESIYKHGVGKQYLLGQKKIILDHAASKIQSVLKAPVYMGVGESQETLVRVRRCEWVYTYGRGHEQP